MALFNVYTDFVFNISREKAGTMKDIREAAVDRLESALDRMGIMSDKPIIDIPDEILMYAQILGMEASDRAEAEHLVEAALRDMGANSFHVSIEQSREQG